MNTLVFVDANVLLYSEDARDPDEQKTALLWLDELWRRQCGRIGMQTLNEFYVNATRKLTPRLPQDVARTKIRCFDAWEPWQFDQATLESAWSVESRYGLHYWDSLVIAAAQHSGCRYLLSEDMGHEQFYGTLQVISPFKSSIDILNATP